MFSRGTNKTYSRLKLRMRLLVKNIQYYFTIEPNFINIIHSNALWTNCIGVSLIPIKNLDCFETWKTYSMVRQIILQHFQCIYNHCIVIDYLLLSFVLSYSSLILIDWSFNVFVVILFCFTSCLLFLYNNMILFLWWMNFYKPWDC